MSDVYTHGHDDSVLRSHRWRTLQNSAGYLVSHLSKGQRVLDVGCGPGTLSCDLAVQVGPIGGVVAIDSSAHAVRLAGEEAAWRGVSNLQFQVADVYRLPFEDSSFDVAHAHQVLQHLGDPVAALAELKRVVVPGGLIAVRDSDYAAMAWYPELDGLERWSQIYHAVTRRNSAEADAGRRLTAWAWGAGLTPQSSASVWCFSEPEDRRWWGGLWADRMRYSAFADQAVVYGVCDRDELSRIADAWLMWAEHPAGWFIVPHGELLCRI